MLCATILSVINYRVNISLVSSVCHNSECHLYAIILSVIIKRVDVPDGIMLYAVTLTVVIH
jgi:hypothetical protein